MTEEAICWECGKVAGQSNWCSAHCYKVHNLKWSIKHLSKMGWKSKPELWQTKIALWLVKRGWVNDRQ
jgi:hypothetical protein